MRKPRIYQTKQRETILLALKEFPHEHLTAETFAAYLQQRGCEIGQATIYRQLDKLEKEGFLLKYTLPDGLSACYQVMDSCKEQDCHSHLICNNCGALTHLDCEAVHKFATHLLTEHGFTLDEHKTVLYGICPACNNTTQ